MDPDEITEEEFFEYEECREDGATNMMDLRTISEITGLPKNLIKEIIDHYEYLCDKFGGGA